MKTPCKLLLSPEFCGRLTNIWKIITSSIVLMMNFYFAWIHDSKAHTTKWNNTVILKEYINFVDWYSRVVVSKFCIWLASVKSDKIRLKNDNLKKNILCNTRSFDAVSASFEESFHLHVSFILLNFGNKPQFCDVFVHRKNIGVNFKVSNTHWST